MENARRFLARAVPWPTSDDNWWISIHWAYKYVKGKALIGRGMAFKTLDDAAWWIERLRDEKPHDMYVCMGGVGVAERRTSKKGRTYYIAERLDENILWLRGFWIDVDVMTALKAAGFKTVAEARDAIALFIRAMGLPPPTYIVMTGSGGFHIHWTLEDPISRAEWQPLADALTAAIRHYLPTLKDAGVTKDPARILRIPDTRNWKWDPPRPASLAHRGGLVTLERMRTALAPWIGVNVERNKSNNNSSSENVSGNLPPRAPIAFDKREAYPEFFDITIDDVAKVCPFIDHTLETAGEGLSEPLWRASLRVAYFTKDPADAALRLSSGYGDDAVAETEDKLAEVEKAHRRRDMGWPQCRAIYDAGATECAACPHLSKGRSPFNFVGTVTAGEQVPPSGNHTEDGTNPPPPDEKPSTNGSAYILPLPEGYEEDEDHYVYVWEDVKIGRDVTRQRVKVAGLPMWDFWPQEPVKGHGEFALSWMAGLNGRTEAPIYWAYNTDHHSMARELNKQGFHLNKKELPHFGDLMSAFVTMLRSQNIPALPCEDLGWSFDGGKRSGFVYHRKRHNCVGDSPVAHVDRELDLQYSVQGTLEHWKQAAKLITDQKIPALDAIVAGAFAATLVSPLGFTGMVVSAYALDTGIGKTAAMRVGTSVWANPNAMTGALDDTTNFVNNHLGRIRHLPFFFDEMQMQNNTTKLVGMIFSASQGKVKGKLKRDSSTMPIATFATMIITASNLPLSDYVIKHTQVTAAGIARLFEFQVPRNDAGTGMIDRPTAQQIIGELEHNHGHAGQIYAQFLGRNAERITREVGKVSKRLTELLKATEDERFWVGTMTCLIMGARYANMLKLTEIDETALLKFLKETFFKLRTQRIGSHTDVKEKETVLNYLSRYLNERQQQTIISKRVWIHAYKPPAGYSAETLTMQNKLFGRIAVRAASEDKILRLSYQDFADWMDKQGRPARPVVDQMKLMLPMRDVHGSLAAHTGIGGTARERLLEFDLKAMPELFNFN